MIYNICENLSNWDSLDRDVAISGRALKRRLLETKVNVAIYVIFAKSDDLLSSGELKLPGVTR